MLSESLLNVWSSAITVAQSSNVSSGFPIVDVLIVVAGVGGALFAVCRSANRG